MSTLKYARCKQTGFEICNKGPSHDIFYTGLLKIGILKYCNLVKIGWILIFAGFKNPKNPGTQPRYKTVFFNMNMNPFVFGAQSQLAPALMLFLAKFKRCKMRISLSKIRIISFRDQNHRTIRQYFIKNAHAYFCYLRNCEFLSKFLESDSQGIRTKFYNEIRYHLLN